MRMQLRVLFVEDSEDDALLIIEELKRGGHNPKWKRVETPAAMSDALDRESWDVVIADYTMPLFSATDALELLRGKKLDLPFIIVSGTIGEETAVAAMKAGVHDYINKDNLIRLVPAIEREIHEAEERRERRRAQQALRESEAKYRDLVENISEVIYVFDKNGIVTYISPAVTDFIGYDPSEIIGKPFADFVFIEEVPRIRENSQRTLSGRPQTNEYRVVSRTGGLRWMRTSSRPIFKGNRIVGVRGVLADITDLKRIEEELRASEANYRAIFDSANDGIFVHDIETGKILDVNRKMSEMFGYSRKEARKLNIGAISSGEPPYTQENALRLLRKAAQGEPQIFEWLSRKKDGRHFWVEVNLKLATIEGKDRLLALVRDITKRKKTEMALRYRIEFEKLITTISTHFINLSSDEIDDAIHFALKEIGEFAGVDRSYVFQLYDGGKKMDNTHEWCAEGIERHIHRLKGLPVDAFSWHMSILKSGKVHHIPRIADIPPEAAAEKEEWEREGIQSLVCVPMLYGGEVIGFAGFDSVRAEKTWDEDTIALLKLVGEIFSNALRRKQAEEALRKSEARYRLLSESLEETVKKKVAELKQAESLAAIGRMVSTVAHEVRNPLQNIQIGVDAMRQEIGADESVLEILNGIDYGVNLLNGIITELLEYSRPVKLKRSPASVRDIVEQSLKIQARKLEGINIRLELDQGEREISVDFIKLSAVLVNLIANAAEAMPEGGDLTIMARFHEIEDAGFLRLSVSDSGCGIGGEYLERIEEPFFTTKVTGTGLGIPICKKIVEAHNGSLTIKSRPGKGTTVEIILPVHGS